jgi:hypothetical protein
MFEISWVDPTSETVGQRKNRKNERPSASSHKQHRTPSIRSSRSTNKFSGQAKPSLPNASPGNKTPPLARTGSNSNRSKARTEQSVRELEQIFPFTASSCSLIHEDTTRIPINNMYTGGSYYTEADQSSLSGGTCSYIKLISLTK